LWKSTCLSLRHIREQAFLYGCRVYERAHLNLPCAASEGALEVRELGQQWILAPGPSTQDVVLAHAHVAIDE